MNQTTNYQLSQWESTDRILMEDFNSDNAKLDEALKSHDDALAALEEGLTGKGNCQIYYTTYTGNGQVGAATPNSLTFPAQPLLVVILQADGLGLRFVPGCTGVTYHRSDNYVNCAVTWSGTTLTWYCTIDNAACQMNSLNTTYHVYTLLQAG